MQRIFKTNKFRKMKKLALLFTVATFAITSCNENKPAEEAVETAVEATETAVEAVADSATATAAEAVTAVADSATAAVTK